MGIKRLLKYGALAFVFALVTLAALVVAYLLWPAPTYRAGYPVPGAGTEIAVELKPSHPVFAEYERRLVMLGSSGKQLEQKMFSDTGGYSRTNLYSLRGGRFLVKGFFDAWVVQVDPLRISEWDPEARQAGTFVGAFDDVDKGGWRFIPAAERTEQSIVPRGG